MFTVRVYDTNSYNYFANFNVYSVYNNYEKLIAWGNLAPKDGAIESLQFVDDSDLFYSVEEIVEAVAMEFWL